MHRYCSHCLCIKCLHRPIQTCSAETSWPQTVQLIQTGELQTGQTKRAECKHSTQLLQPFGHDAFILWCFVLEHPLHQKESWSWEISAPKSFAAICSICSSMSEYPRLHIGQFRLRLRRWTRQLEQMSCSEHCTKLKYSISLRPLHTMHSF